MSFDLNQSIIEVELLTDLRLLTGVDSDKVFLKERNAIYDFNPTIVLDDDNRYCIKPTATLTTDPGRWLALNIVSSKTIYVDPTNGNDSVKGDGYDQDLPLKTVGKAITNASNGDLIKVSIGTSAESLTNDTPILNLKITGEASTGPLGLSTFITGTISSAAPSMDLSYLNITGAVSSTTATATLNTVRLQSTVSVPTISATNTLFIGAVTTTAGNQKFIGCEFYGDYLHSGTATYTKIKDCYFDGDLTITTPSGSYIELDAVRGNGSGVISIPAGCTYFIRNVTGMSINAAPTAVDIVDSLIGQGNSAATAYAMIQQTLEGVNIRQAMNLDGRLTSTLYDLPNYSVDTTLSGPTWERHSLITFNQQIENISLTLDTPTDDSIAYVVIAINRGVDVTVNSKLIPAGSINIAVLPAGSSVWQWISPTTQVVKTYATVSNFTAGMPAYMDSTGQLACYGITSATTTASNLTAGSVALRASFSDQTRKILIGSDLANSTTKIYETSTSASAVSVMTTSTIAGLFDAYATADNGKIYLLATTSTSITLNYVVYSGGLYGGLTSGGAVALTSAPRNLSLAYGNGLVVATYVNSNNELRYHVFNGITGTEQASGTITTNAFVERIGLAYSSNTNFMIVYSGSASVDTLYVLTADANTLGSPITATNDYPATSGTYSYLRYSNSAWFHVSGSRTGTIQTRIRKVTETGFLTQIAKIPFEYPNGTIAYGKLYIVASMYAGTLNQLIAYPFQDNRSDGGIALGLPAGNTFARSDYPAQGRDGIAFTSAAPSASGTLSIVTSLYTLSNTSVPSGKVVGIFKTSGSSGNPAQIATDGETATTGLTGLTPGTVYYDGQGSGLVIDGAGTRTAMGRSLSATELRVSIDDPTAAATVTDPVTSSLTPVYYNGTTFAAAKANQVSTLAMLMTLSTGQRLSQGRVTFNSHGYTVGAQYYLSQTVAGGFTSTKPATGLVQSVFYVESANTLHINIDTSIMYMSENGQSILNGNVSITAGANVWQTILAGTIPTAGKWLVTFTAYAGQASGGTGRLGVFRGDGSFVVDSLTSVIYQITGADMSAVSGNTFFITTTGPETLSLSGKRTTATSSFTITGSTDITGTHSTKITWVKMGDYSPVVGTIFDYLYLRKTTDGTGIVGGSDISWTNSLGTGAFPLNADNTTVTLPAGDYRIAYSLSIDQHAASQPRSIVAAIVDSNNNELSILRINSYTVDYNTSASHSPATTGILRLNSPTTIKVRCLSSYSSGILVQGSLLIERAGLAATATQVSTSFGGTTTINATTTAPAKATTLVKDSTRAYVDTANQARCVFEYACIANTGATAGTGAYLFSLPTGVQFNTSVHPLYTADVTTAAGTATAGLLAASIPANGNVIFAAQSIGVGVRIVPYTATTYRVILITSTSSVATIGSANAQLSAILGLSWEFNFTAA